MREQMMISNRSESTSDSPSTLFAHGPIDCRDCFSSDETLKIMGDWRLNNNPGYYGSPNPKTLVLGFSKGANQNRTALAGDFDKIAFAGARGRLQAILEVLGLMPKDRSIDSLMTAKESEFGVASIVRCSFCKMKDGKCKTSGDVIPSAFTNHETLAVIERCISKYLTRLPESVVRVILLGTDDRYIVKTKNLVERLYPDFEKVSRVAFRAGGALWVYATHPSPLNGYFTQWTSGSLDTIQGRKRQLALDALNN
jgi:hypothetical protein